MSAPPRKSLLSRSWRRPCLPMCPCGVPSPEHLTPRGISLLASPRARGASCPLRHSRGGPAHLQACHPGGVTKDELESAQLQGLHPPGPTGTVGRATEGGGHSSALPGGLWGCSPGAVPHLLRNWNSDIHVMFGLGVLSPSLETHLWPDSERRPRLQPPGSSLSPRGHCHCPLSSLENGASLMHTCPLPRRVRVCEWRAHWDRTKRPPALFSCTHSWGPSCSHSQAGRASDGRRGHRSGSFASSGPAPKESGWSPGVGSTPFSWPGGRTGPGAEGSGSRRAGGRGGG